ELAYWIAPEVPRRFRGDPVRLRQILTNLVGNAVKFTQKGEVVVTVMLVKDSTEEAELRFEVRDTGMGITPDVKDKLFQVFTQADNSTTRKFGGTGLGLAISKRLCELMQGTIGVESEPEKGSLFWFTLRLRRDRSAPASTRKPIASLRGARGLIVDDNATNRRIVRMQLETHGMHLEEAESGSRALEALKSALERGQPFEVAVI